VKKMSDDIEKIADNQMSKQPESVSIKKSTYNKLIVGIMVGAVLSAFFGGYVLGTETGQSSETIIKNSKDAADQPSKKISGSVNFDIPPFAGFLGDESAPISIVEFGDYQCPFCKRFFDQTEPQLMQEYVMNGKAKFYFLDFALVGPDSLTLAEGAWCAEEQGKYYQYHDYVYSNQGDENSGWGTPEKVKSFARDLGLDVEEFSLCLDSKKYESRVQQLTAMAQGLGSTGTPTSFIGNKELGFTRIIGAQPYAAFQQVLDSLLAK
jgi:protein-disulfide isomerase